MGTRAEIKMGHKFKHLTILFFSVLSVFSTGGFPLTYWSVWQPSNRHEEKSQRYGHIQHYKAGSYHSALYSKWKKKAFVMEEGATGTLLRSIYSKWVKGWAFKRTWRFVLNGYPAEQKCRNFTDLVTGWRQNSYLECLYQIKNLLCGETRIKCPFKFTKKDIPNFGLSWLGFELFLETPLLHLHWNSQDSKKMLALPELSCSADSLKAEV